MLDWAADVGGLLGAISPICVSLVFLFHYKSQYMYMMRELFVEPVSSADTKIKDPSKSYSKTELETEARNKMKNVT